MQRAAIYSRKSKFTGKGESVENQVEMCRQYINLHLEDVDKDNIVVYEDEGFSGGNTARPQFQAMVNAIRKREIDLVICYRLDRITRNLNDFSGMMKDFEEYNVIFVSVKEQFDMTNPMGKAMMNLTAVFAELERETIRDRIRDNMHELAKHGRWLGGNTPTGYKSVELVNKITVDGREKKAYKLEIVKDEAVLIHLIFSKFLETSSLTKVETYLLQNHIKTKNTKNFSRFTIRAILSNPVYMIADKEAWDYYEEMGVEIYAEQSAFDGRHGIMAYNKTEQKPGKSNKVRDMKEWIIAVGKHKGMIPGKEWVKVQRLLGQNNSKSYRKQKSNQALLSGLLFCGNCGSFMRPKQSQRVNANGEKVYSYLCETKEKSRMKNCAIKNPQGNELDKMICDEIKRLSENSSEFVQKLRKAEKIVKGDTKEYDRQIEQLKTSLRQTEKEIQALVDSLSKAGQTAAYGYITDKINVLDEKKQGLETQIQQLKQLMDSDFLSQAQFDILEGMLSSFADTFDSMSIERKRTALRAFIRKIVWDGENIHLYLFGAEDNDTISLQEMDALTNEPESEPLRVGRK